MADRERFSRPNQARRARTPRSRSGRILVAPRRGSHHSHCTRLRLAPLRNSVGTRTARLSALSERTMHLRRMSRGACCRRTREGTRIRRTTRHQVYSTIVTQSSNQSGSRPEPDESGRNANGEIAQQRAAGNLRLKDQDLRELRETRDTAQRPATCSLGVQSYETFVRPSPLPAQALALFA